MDFCAPWTSGTDCLRPLLRRAHGRLLCQSRNRKSNGLLHAIFRLSLVDSLPLHIRRGIWPAALQGDDIINNVAGAWACRQMRGWAGMLALEGCPGGLATLYAPVGVTLGLPGSFRPIW